MLSLVYIQRDIIDISYGQSAIIIEIQSFSSRFLLNYLIKNRARCNVYRKGVSRSKETELTWRVISRREEVFPDKTASRLSPLVGGHRFTALLSRKPFQEAQLPSGQKSPPSFRRNRSFSSRVNFKLVKGKLSLWWLIRVNTPATYNRSMNVSRSSPPPFFPTLNLINRPD